MTIRAALKLVIGAYPDYHIFNGIDLLRRVKPLIDKKNCYDGSIFRVMRYGRDRYKDFNYEVVSQPDSKYRKLPVYNEPVYREGKNGQFLMRI